MAHFVGIMQPAYLPWTGYMALIDLCDTFVLLDTVAVNEKSWQNRNRVVNSQGNETWLSIPTHSSQGMLLKDVQIAEDGRWRRKHQGTLRAISDKGAVPSPMRTILGLYDPHSWESLVHFTSVMLVELCNVIGIRTPIVRAAEYGLPIRTNPIDRIADILERTGATDMIDTIGAERVLETNMIPTGGNPNWVPIHFLSHTPASYGQGKRPEFLPYMSVVDCLARHGPRKTLEVIRSG